MRSMRWMLALSLALVTTPMLVAGCATEPPPKPLSPPPPPPPPPDADGDGVPDDGTDKCLAEKEDGLPPDPKDGCKSTDADGDGIVGDADKCPNEKEDGLPPDAKDGCKSTDPDGDGVIGDADKCPDKPETVNGYMDEDGCPDIPPRVFVTKTEVKIGEKIMFAFGKSDIDAKSNELLDEIAKILNENPQIEFFEIAGNADNVGDPKRNVTLTTARATSVANALAKRGVDKRRFRAVGYGEYCPLDKANTDEAREKNRRVEFKIMRVTGVETNVQLGCEAAVTAGIKPQPTPKTAPTQAELDKSKTPAKPPVTVAIPPKKK